MRRILTMLLTGCSVFGLVGGTVLTQAGAEGDREALAKELRGAWLPLESGMTTSRREGTPISAKYEIDNGTFQLSVYITRGDRLSEVIVDHNVGTIAKVDVLTDSGDLAAARDQKEAMARATRTLEAATADLVRANSGYRAVSAMPRLNDGHPIVDVLLVNGTDWRVVHERLD